MSTFDMTKVGAVTGKTPFFVPLETEMVDLIGGVGGVGFKVLDHGHVVLMDVMPRIVPVGRTADIAVVEAARLSYAGRVRLPAEDRGLLRYLLRHRHTSPFEQVEFKFHCRMPIFVARQWVRHRMASLNEISARYTELKDEFYIPDIDALRKQSKTNKQGRDEPVDPGVAESVRIEMAAQSREAFAAYKGFIADGLARELARAVLPVSIYTEWVWKIDLHNLLRFLGLRMDSHAQFEIREYANALHDLIAPLAPDSVEAWRDYEFEALHLSRLEVAALREEIEDLRRQRDEYARVLHGMQAEESWRSGQTYVPFTPVHVSRRPLTDNKRESDEWEAKRSRLGL